jgi:hypothetical protein
VTEGRTQLDAVLRSDDDPTATTLQSIRDRFSRAYQLDRSNRQAAMGYAVSDVAVAAQRVIDVLTRSRGVSRAELAKDPAYQVASSAIGWNVSRPSANTTSRALKSATSLPFSLAGRRRSVDLNQLRAELTALYDTLNNALPIMETVAADPTFTFPIADFQDGEGERLIDQADVQTILGALYAAQAVLGVGLAYEFDYGQFDFNQRVGDRFANKTPGSTVTPNEYLPPAPFGNLRSNGGGLFAASRAGLGKAADLIKAAATTMQNRPAPDGHLIDSGTFTAGDFADVRDGADDFKAALTSQYTFEDGTTINANAWFSSPPASLRAFVPTYQVVEYTYFDFNLNRDNTTIQLIAGPGDFPDKTFGGLIVNPNNDSFNASAFPTDTVGSLATASGSDYFYGF